MTLTARRSLWIVLGALAVLWAGWSTGSVAAHAELLEVTPADGQVVAEAPAQVEVRFSEPVSLTGGSARVLDDEAVVVSGEASTSGATIVIPLGADLHDGTYTVTWQVISEDSHPISGATVFHVGAPSAGGGAVVEPTGPQAGLGVRVGAGLLVALGYAGALVGAGAWWVLLATRAAADTDDRSPFAERARSLATRAGVLGAAALVASLPLRVARLGGGLGALRENDFLTTTLRGPIGASTLVTVAGLLVLAGLVGSRGLADERAMPPIAAAAGLVALAGFAIEGHTRTQHPIGLMIALDVVHLAAGAVWLGGVAVLVVAIRSRPEPTALARIVARFSTLAVGAVIGVVLAGLGMAWIVLPSPGDIVTTGYGLALLTKVALVLPVIGMGAYNRRQLVPAMSAGAAAGERRTRLGRIVVVELIVLLAVVGVTSVLVNRSPVASSASPATTAPPPADAIEIPLSGGAGTALYTFAPAKAGQNEMTLSLRDPLGQPLASIEPPTIELTEPTLGVGPLRPIVHPLDPGEFHVIADVPLAGTYDAVIRVRVSDFVAATAETTIVVR